MPETTSPLFRVTGSLCNAANDLRRVKLAIEQTWPDYAERPGPALELGSSLETILVELETACKAEGPAFDRWVAEQKPKRVEVPP